MSSALEEHTRWQGTDGKPVVGGLVFFGTQGQDPTTGYPDSPVNLITVYTDRALTVVAANPQTTTSNGRTTNKIYVPDKYSLALWDSDDVQLYINLDTGRIETNSESVSFLQTGTGAVSTTVQKRLREIVSIVDFGTVGDGITDDILFIQAAIDHVGTLSASDNLRRFVLIPPGKYLCSNFLLMKDHIYLINNGNLLFDSGATSPGTFVLFRSVIDCGIVGNGIVDCDNLENMNGIASSGLTSLGGESRRILISGQTIKNCDHKIANEVGNGGGKGISIQHGPREVIIDNCFIYDCDLGISVEGKSTDGGSTSVIINNVKIKDAEWTGIWIDGDYTGIQTAADNTEVRINNLVLEDCGKDVTVTDGYAPIILDAAFNVIGNIKVRNTSGVHDVVRGHGRFVNLEIDADVNDTRHVINHEFWAGFGGSDTQAQSNVFNVTFRSRTAPTSGDFLLRGSGSNDVGFGTYEFKVSHYDGVDFINTDYPGGLIENVDETTNVDVHDMGTGKPLLYQGPSKAGRQYTASLDDEGFLTYQVRNDFGSAEVAILGATVRSATVSWDSVGTLRCGGHGHADIEFTTGALTGTTGNDLKVTVSIDTSRLLYVENQLGTTVPVNINEN